MRRVRRGTEQSETRQAEQKPVNNTLAQHHDGVRTGLPREILVVSYRGACRALSTYFIRSSKRIVSSRASSSRSRLPRVFSLRIAIISINCCAAGKSAEG